MCESERRPLEDVSVGIYLAPEGSEEVEFVEPRDALSEAGANLEVVGPETGGTLTVNCDLEESDCYEVERDVVDGRTLTSYPSLQTDVENAGGEWVDEEVVTDGPLVTSRKPDDLEAFFGTLIEAFADAGS